MKISKHLWIFVIVVCSFVCEVQCASYQNYKDLYSAIFSGYNINLRPVVNDSRATEVNVEFVLLSLEGISEKEQTLTTSAWLVLRWRDEILQWDPAVYNGVQSLQVQQKNLWLPDIVLKNTVKQRSKMGFDEQPAVVVADGSIIWAPGDIYVTSCDLSITYYPFDVQTCRIKFYLWLSDSTEIKLLSDKGDIDREFYSENGQWEIVNTTARLMNMDGTSEVSFEIKLKRRYRLYIVSIIIPILFLSCLGPLVFALPAESGEKMGFSVTVLLAYTVFLTIIGDNMPQTSTQTAILSIYLTAMLTISALAVILSVVSLRVYHKSEESKPYSKLQSVTRILRRILCLSHPRENTVSPEVKMNHLTDSKTRPSSTSAGVGEGNPNITWKMVSQTLDALFLLLFSVLTVLFTLPSLITMASQAIHVQNMG